mgnify:CR=1 FL=1
MRRKPPHPTIMKHQNLIITEQRIKLKRYKDGKILKEILEKIDFSSYNPLSNDFISTLYIGLMSFLLNSMYQYLLHKQHLIR